MRCAPKASAAFILFDGNGYARRRPSRPRLFRGARCDNPLLHRPALPEPTRARIRCCVWWHSPCWACHQAHQPSENCQCGTGRRGPTRQRSDIGV